MALLSPLQVVLYVLFCTGIKVSSFSVVQRAPLSLRNSDVITTRVSFRCHAHKQGVTFQYSPSSLHHLQAVELPDDSLRNGWTREKFQATAGALIVGCLAGAIGEWCVQSLIHESNTFVLFGPLGATAGWILCGGNQVRQQEMPMNGGYDAKLVYDVPSRLKSILEDLSNDSNAVVIETLPSERDLNNTLDYIRQVHGDDYVNEVETKSRESDRPRRFNPLYARTLLDQFTFDAAVHAVGDWMDSVDAALSEKPQFALVRPPSHHACRNAAMGGCYFNSVAIAAMYALDQPGINHVAILDIDAHHGNGIAHCIQEEPRIRYCSIHEGTNRDFYMLEKKISDKDPRRADSSDHGPLANILNINIPSKTGWKTGYQEALEKVALPFLLEDESDILLVAAGFDAMESDFSSGLTLQPSDYEKIGATLFDAFGNRVAFGLEGGYCFKNHDLGRGLLEFVKPWQ